MIRIAVCDDENVIVNQIEHIISEVCKRESIPVNIDVFYSGRELKRQVTSGTKYDIIFLDIQMKGGDGITAAENIRKVDDNVLLIYVSGYDKYMMELFRLDVFGFIKKPIDEEILTKTFLETYQRVCSKMVYFTFSYKHEEYKILCKEILYFESNARKVTIYTQNGEHYTFNGKLSEIEQIMSEAKNGRNTLTNNTAIFWEGKSMYNQIEDILLNISIVIATVWIVKRFWGSFFEEKQNSILSVSLWIVYCIFQFFFGYHNGRLQIFATILNILLILSIAMVAYQSRGKEKYFLLATFYAGWSLIEVFVFSLINSFDIGESQQRDIIGLVLSNILMILSVYALSMVAEKRKESPVPGKYYFFLLLVPVGSIVIAINEFCSEGKSFFAVITISILILFNVIIFELYVKINKVFAYEKEHTVYAQQFDMIEKITVSQKKMLEEFYEDRHNLLNKLIVLKNSVENSDKESVIRNLNQIIKNSNISENISNTGNSTIDCLINFKYAVAKEYGITFQLKIFIPEELPMEPCDIGIALGNALDNAIEAVRDCRQHQRVIEISMGVKKQALVMLIKNPYEHVLKNDRSGKYQSTKTESGRHGYGLNSIARIAEKYQGEILVEAQDSVFFLTVVMNLPEN